MSSLINNTILRTSNSTISLATGNNSAPSTPGTTPSGPRIPEEMVAKDLPPMPTDAVPYYPPSELSPADWATMVFHLSCRLNAFGTMTPTTAEWDDTIHAIGRTYWAQRDKKKWVYPRDFDK